MTNQLSVPREADAYLPLAAKFDDATTTDVEVGIAPAGTRPVVTWTAWPGPHNPQTPGVYLVLIRKLGTLEVAEVGHLTVT